MCVREILTSIVFRQILILRFFVQKFNEDLSATSYMKFRRCHVSLFTPVFLPLLPTPNQRIYRSLTEIRIALNRAGKGKKEDFHLENVLRG